MSREDRLIPKFGPSMALNVCRRTSREEDRKSKESPVDPWKAEESIKYIYRTNTNGLL